MHLSNLAHTELNNIVDTRKGFKIQEAKSMMFPSGRKACNLPAITSYINAVLKYVRL